MMERKTRINLTGLGILIILLSTALSLGYFMANDRIVQLLELTISPDESITLEGRQQLNSIFYFFMFLLLITGLILLKAQNGELRATARRVLLTDGLVSSPVKPSPLFILGISTLAGLFLIIHIRLYDPSTVAFEFFYMEDGLFESITAILMIIAALLLIPVVLRTRKESIAGGLSNYLQIAYLVLIVSFVLYAMEEISWGQRIFGWETPESISTRNLQNETNIHNFFNEYFLSAYRLLILFPLPIVISAWLELKQSALPLARPILPAPHMIGLAILIAAVAFVWPQDQELLEEMVAVFILFYSLRIFNCFRSKDLQISARSGVVSSYVT